MEAVLILLILLACGNAASFSNNPSETKSLVFQSSERFISTSSNVWHMEIDQHKNDGSILFADGSTLKTVTKDKSVSTVVSGFGGSMTGFEQLNSTHLAVVDDGAHCVKMVNRVDKSVRVLAGQCGNSGPSDGNPGQFYHPWSAEEDVRHAGSGKLLITDQFNHALRSVDVNSGVISTVISSGFKYPRGMAWNKDHLLVTNQHYISEVVWSDDDTITNTLLAGSTSTVGSADGGFTTSRFYYPREISPITSSRFLVSDHNNKKLRLLGVTRREVLPVCTNSLSPCTESTVLGYNPVSVLQTAEAVYVGGGKQITKLTGSDIFTITAAPPPTATRPPCQDRNVTVRLRDDESSATVHTGDGDLLKLEPGHHQYTKDNCTVNVIVEKIIYSTTPGLTTTSTPACQTRDISVTLQEGESRADVKVSAGRWLELGVGIHKYTDTYSGNCTIIINVEKAIYSTTPELTTTSTPGLTTTSRPKCKTRNISVTLQEGEPKADVEVFSGKWAELVEGVYKFTDTRSGNCTVIINVVRSASFKTTCPESITRVASSDTKTAAVEIPGTKKGYKLELPIGQFSLNIPYGSAICNITINVVDPNIRRRVTFQAVYDVKCGQAAAAVAKNIIFSTAQQHFEQIKELCSKYCKPRVTRKPIIACANDKLIIQWPTNPVYGGETLDIKPDVKSALKQQVSGRGVSTFTLVVPSKIPPVVYPVRNSDGASVTFSLTSFCVGNFTYNPHIDRCQ